MARLSESRTLADLLHRRAAAHPDRIALTFLGDGEVETEQWSYAELLERAQTIARYLEECTHCDDRVLLAYPPGLEFVAALFACFLSNRIAVPVYPPDPMRLEQSRARLALIADNAEAACVLTSELLRGLVQGVDFGSPYAAPGRWLATDTLETRDGEYRPRSTPRHEDIAFLQYTSGSTTQPRGVTLAHANLLANLQMIRSALRWDETSCCITWLPLYHDMGLIGTILGPLSIGARSYIMSPLHFIERPMRWLEAIDRYRGTFTASPNFGYELCVKRSTDAERCALDLSCWKIAGNGAEPIRIETLQRFADAFRPAGFRREMFYPCYGLAEATLMVSGGHPDEAYTSLRLDRQRFIKESVAVPLPSTVGSDDAHVVVGCGKEFEEEAIRIVDPATGELVAEGQIGEIWIAGPHITPGYWRSPQSSATLFGTVAGDETRTKYLRTGDLGFLHAGELYCTGRIKDLCIVNGQNYYAHDLERSIEVSHPAVRAGGACIVPRDEHLEGILAIVETREGVGDEPNEIVHAIARRLNADYLLSLNECVLVPPRSLIKTPSGKKARWATRQALAEGRITIIHRWHTLERRPPTKQDATN